jgi:hypothetical protein
MANFKWHDGNANQTGYFQVYKDGSWHDLSDGYGIAANDNTNFGVETDFDGATGAYVTFVTITSDSLSKGVKLTTAGSQVSVALNTGNSTIQFRAAVLISDDPKVNISWSRSGTATCYLTWNGSYWTFSGTGAPSAGGDTFNVTANQVTIVVTNSQSNTSSSLYTSDNTSNTVGSIVATAAGSLTETITGSAGTSSYIVNVFQPLDEAGNLAVT